MTTGGVRIVRSLTHIYASRFCRQLKSGSPSAVLHGFALHSVLFLSEYYWTRSALDLSCFKTVIWCFVLCKQRPRKSYGWQRQCRIERQWQLLQLNCNNAQHHHASLVRLRCPFECKLLLILTSHRIIHNFKIAARTVCCPQGNQPPHGHNPSEVNPLFIEKASPNTLIEQNPR